MSRPKDAASAPEGAPAAKMLQIRNPHEGKICIGRKDAPTLILPPGESQISESDWTAIKALPLVTERGVFAYATV